VLRKFDRPIPAKYVAIKKLVIPDLWDNSCQFRVVSILESDRRQGLLLEFAGTGKGGEGKVVYGQRKEYSSFLFNVFIGDEFV
jgi:hypothetical protein